jgi:hypothetical protein
MKKLLLYSTLLCASITSIFAQNNANNWVFGVNTTLNFNTNPPSVAANGNTIDDGNTLEASATMSDMYGNLLFYTNGTNLYDKSNKLITSALSSTATASQGNIIIPVPGAKNQYFLATTDAASLSCSGAVAVGSDRGSRYRMVTVNDSTVTVSAETVLKASGITEAQMAVPSSDGNYWLITKDRNNNNFNVSKVTNASIATPSSTSITDSPILGACDYDVYLKANNCYTKFVMVGAGVVSLFSFNNTSGEISYITQWALTNAYSAEFPMSGNYLYVNTDNNATNVVYQYDISSGVSATIKGTEKNIGSALSALQKFGQLQIGSDGIIYATQLSTWSSVGQQYIGAIVAPQSSSATFDNKYISIANTNYNQRLGLGLPTFTKSFVANVRKITAGNEIFPKAKICVGENVPLSITINSGFSSNPTKITSWEIENATITGNEVSHVFNFPGKIPIKVTSYDACDYAKIQVDTLAIIDYQAADIILNPTCPNPSLSAIGSLANNYKWFDKDPNVNNANLLQISATYNGNSATNYWAEPVGATYASVGALTIYPGSPSSANENTSFVVYKKLFLATVNTIPVSYSNTCKGNVNWELRKGAVGGTLVASGALAVTTCNASTKISINKSLAPGTYFMVYKSGVSVDDGGSYQSANSTITGVASVVGSTKYASAYNGPFGGFVFVDELTCTVADSMTTNLCCDRPVIATQPSDYSICKGINEAIYFELANNPVSTVLKWQQAADTTKPNTYIDIANTTTNLNYTAETSTWYRAIAVSTPIKCTTNTKWVKLNVQSVDTSVTVLHNVLTANQADAIYQWIDCNNNNLPIDKQTNQSFTPTSPGNYAVIVHKICTDTSSCRQINIVTDIDDYQSTKFTVYPNPSKEVVHINLNEITTGFLTISDVNGLNVYQKAFNDATLSFATADFSSGVYVVKITTATFTSVAQIVILK